MSHYETLPPLLTELELSILTLTTVRVVRHGIEAGLIPHITIGRGQRAQYRIPREFVKPSVMVLSAQEKERKQKEMVRLYEEALLEEEKRRLAVSETPPPLSDDAARPSADAAVAAVDTK